MNAGKILPEVVEKSQQEIDEIIERIQTQGLVGDAGEFVIKCIKLAVWMPMALAEHKITVRNLQKLLFGTSFSSSKSTTDSNNDSKNSDKTVDSAELDEVPPPPNDSPDEDAGTKKKKTNGNGRHPHTAYEDAVIHQLSLDMLKAGMGCPESCGGKLYSIKPGVLVRVKGQNLASVHKYYVEKLRCTLCGIIMSADIPYYVGSQKYDAAFKAMLALQKYYLGMPFHRQAYFQKLLGFPLAASTQWQLVEELASVSLSIFPVLEKMAANGSLIHNDDTFLKIIEVMLRNKQHPDVKRTGMFTTGILSTYEDHKIALFYNSRRHSGENMERLLAKRQEERGTVIQMCDALSHNVPESFKTLLCNCLSHGFRKFKELKEFYPEPCLHIIKQLSKVYKADEASRVLNHTPELRLAYHQEHSAPIMNEVREFIQHLMDSKQVEPNESLGKAIKYMLRHWDKLTQFLHVAGAPIDNNVLERALKIPIRNRKAAFFYKTEYSAMIGGVLTSLIYTCELADINPLDYLIALQENKDQVVKKPKAWLPWNYADNQTESSEPLAA